MNFPARTQKSAGLTWTTKDSLSSGRGAFVPSVFLFGDLAGGSREPLCCVAARQAEHWCGGGEAGLGWALGWSYCDMAPRLDGMGHGPTLRLTSCVESRAPNHRLRDY